MLSKFRQEPLQKKKQAGQLRENNDINGHHDHVTTTRSRPPLRSPSARNAPFLFLVLESFLEARVTAWASEPATLVCQATPATASVAVKHVGHVCQIDVCRKHAHTHTSTRTKSINQAPLYVTIVMERHGYTRTRTHTHTRTHTYEYAHACGGGAVSAHGGCNAEKTLSHCPLCCALNPNERQGDGAETLEESK